MTRGANRGLGLDWDFPNLIGLINNRGETLIHEVGMRCTCKAEDTHAGQVTHGAHALRRRTQFGCEKCGGEGFIFRKPRKITALLTGARQQKSQADSGWAEPGDAIVSVKPNIVISGGDKITFTWPEIVPDGQVIIRGAADVSDNKTRKTNLEPDEDRLWYNAVESVYCEDEDGNTYNVGDFILDGSKVIRWIGNQPQKYTAYTLKYKAYLEWIAFFPPDLRRDRDRDLGQRIPIRKRHVAIVNEDPTVTLQDRVPFCDRVSSC